MAFPVPVWKRKIEELEKIKESQPPSEPAPSPPSGFPKTEVEKRIEEVQQIQKEAPVQPAPSPPSGFPKTEVEKRIEEVQQIEPVEKAPVPYKPDAPYIPPKETLTPKEYYQEQKAHERLIKTRIRERPPLPSDPFRIQTPLYPIQKKIYDIDKERLQTALVQQQQVTETARRGIYEWHPETKIVKTTEGYQIVFPYEGAEKYSTYKEMYQRKPGLLFATALTGGDPLGIPSAYYKAIGEEQKAFDIKVKALHKTRSQSFFQHYISMPTTQIGLAGAAGIGLGGITGAGYLTGTAAKVGMTITGGTLIGAGASRPVGLALTGKPGEALGSAAVLGLTIGAGYAGFKSGQKMIRRAYVGERHTLPSGKEAQVIGKKPYMDVFGKRMFYGKTEYLAGRIVKPGPDMTTYQGIPQRVSPIRSFVHGGKPVPGFKA